MQPDAEKKITLFPVPYITYHVVDVMFLAELVANLFYVSMKIDLKLTDVLPNIWNLRIRQKLKLCRYFSCTVIG